MSTTPIIEQHQIDRVSDFLNKLPNKHKYRATTVYRGHVSSEWKLTPGLFRIERASSITFDRRKLEDSLLENFEKQATPFLRSIPQSKLEWIALAQHHGLPTRLLDWTESPLTSLFFAVDDPSEKYFHIDGVVWSLVGFTFRDQPFENFKEIDDEVGSRPNNVYFPHHTTGRISAQQGCFTVHAQPDDEFVPLEEQALAGSKSIKLTKFVTPARKKQEIRYELDKLGINHFTLFPDLDGLSRKLVWDISNPR